MSKKVEVVRGVDVVSVKVDPHERCITFSLADREIVLDGEAGAKMQSAFHDYIKNEHGEEAAQAINGLADLIVRHLSYLRQKKKTVH